MGIEDNVPEKQRTESWQPISRENGKPHNLLYAVFIDFKAIFNFESRVKVMLIWTEVGAFMNVLN